MTDKDFYQLLDDNTILHRPIQKKFLNISKKLITMNRFAQKDVKPLNEGKDVRFRRYERFNVETSTISEGVTPMSDTLRQTTIKVTLEQYGSWVPVTDLMLALSTDPLVQQITERQAIQMAEQMDTIAYNAFVAGTSAFYSDGADYDDSTDVKETIAGHTAYQASGGANVNAKLLSAVVRFLESKDSMKISSVVKPASAYNTEPVAEGYFAITHPDTRADIEAIPGFTPIEKYANYGAVLSGEIGKVGLMRFITTTLATTSTSNGGSSNSANLKELSSGVAKIYRTLVFAQDAVGCVSLSGQDSVVPKVVTPAPTSEDPLGQRGSVGYSYMYGCTILQENNLVRIEHAVSNISALA